MANVSFRMDDDLKRQTEAVLEELGLNMTTAMTMFAKAVVREQGIPFALSIETPNAGTRAAMREVGEMKRHPEKYTGYTDVDRMMEKLLA